ncbi:MAG: acyltransferase family protein [Pirellulales bacterium]
MDQAAASIPVPGILPTTGDARRHDLDALRAFAMLLGIGLHASLSFFRTPWPVQDSQPNELFGLLFILVHGFRMPLFFLVSGYFTMLLFRRRGLPALLKQRFGRILVPFLLGAATLVPLTAWVSLRAMQDQARAVKVVRIESLAAAVRAGDAAKIEAYLPDDSQLNQLDGDFGVSPLSWAVLRRDRALVNRLLDRGADVNAANRDGNRPLHAAAFLGGDDLAAALLARGADASARSLAGDRPIAATNVDWEATQYMVGLLGLPLPERESLEAERAKVRARLAQLDENVASASTENGGQRGSDARGTWLNAMHDAYQRWLHSDRWRYSAAGRTLHLFDTDLFAHLWFLWFLCWLVAGFALIAPAAERWLTGWNPRWFAWLLAPLTLLPEALMGQGPVRFGPDTATGLLPQPHLLAYYGLFFAYGALGFAAQEHGAVWGRRGWSLVCVAVLLAFPATLAAIGNLAVTTVAQTVYAWTMSLGLIGVFRRHLPSESRVLRYVADSSYWLYLAHLPLVIGLQWQVRDWPLPAALKFLAINVVAVALLLVAYHWLVRPTWLGALLNGRRQLPSPHRLCDGEKGRG